MPIISGRDNENNRWKRNSKTKKKAKTKTKTKAKKKQTKAEKNKGDRSYNERVRAKWFSCAFKFGFLQLICKARVSFINYFKTKRIMSQSMLQWSVHV